MLSNFLCVLIVLRMNGLYPNRLIGQNTSSVLLETLVGIEVHNEGASGSQLLHDFLLIHTTVVAVQIMDVCGLGSWHAVFEFAASLASGTGPRVWGAVFIDGIEVLQENSVHKGPTSMATLVQEIAVKSVLGGEAIVQSILDLDSALKHTSG